MACLQLSNLGLYIVLWLLQNITVSVTDFMHVLLNSHAELHGKRLSILIFYITVQHQLFCTNVSTHMKTD